VRGSWEAAAKVPRPEGSEPAAAAVAAEEEEEPVRERSRAPETPSGSLMGLPPAGPASGAAPPAAV
jgi:hypothetical protein